jgi:hypothetical protein
MSGGPEVLDSRAEYVTFKVYIPYLRLRLYRPVFEEKLGTIYHVPVLASTYKAAQTSTMDAHEKSWHQKTHSMFQENSIAQQVGGQKGIFHVTTVREYETKQHEDNA